MNGKQHKKADVMKDDISDLRSELGAVLHFHSSVTHLEFRPFSEGCLL